MVFILVLQSKVRLTRINAFEFSTLWDNPPGWEHHYTGGSEGGWNITEEIKISPTILSLKPLMHKLVKENDCTDTQPKI